MKGVVIKSTGSWYNVQNEDGSVVSCRIKGKFRIKGIRTTNPIAVGDHVSYKLEEDDTGVIHEIEERRNYIIRKSIKLSKHSHILASNIDQAILIVTLATPVTSSSFIDRFLTTAEAYHIPVQIIFNKTDLYGDDEDVLMEIYSQAYGDLGYPCHQFSSEDPHNTEDIAALFKDKITLLAGHSGVGKSTMANIIEPGLDLRTDEVSDMHLTGKHTTTFAEMHPLSFGGAVIDTPGIKSFGLVDMDKSLLAQRFPEMRAKMDMCHFNNCLHLKEPNCEIKRLYGLGFIANWRYENYLTMMSDDEDEKYRAKL